MMEGAEAKAETKEEDAQSAASPSHTSDTPRRSSSGKIQRKRTSSRPEEVRGDAERAYDAKYFLNLKQVHDRQGTPSAAPLPSPDSPGYNGLSPASKAEEKAKRQGRPFPPNWREVYTTDQAKHALDIAVAASPRVERAADDSGSNCSEESSSKADAKKSPRKGM